ncbi:MAG: CidA/LrgA family protein [Lachnospiraceae bacterium]
MKYIRQFLIILAFSFAGELLRAILPLPIPASIYGLVLLFAALQSGILRLDVIKETAGFLINIMPLLFIPAGVGLIESWDALKPMLLPVVVIMVITTVVVMGASGQVTQIVMRGADKRKEKETEGVQEIE